MSFFQSLLKAPKTNVNFPDRSPEEAALLREQTDILRKQEARLSESLRQQDLLQPLLFGELGIQAIKDASGNIVGYEKAALTPEQQQQQQIESKLRERTLAALEGNLPVDPALERSLTEGRATLGETLLRQLGPGYETSTPGIQALAEFNKRAEELRFGARTGALSLSEQLSGAREARDLQRDALTFGNIMGTTNARLPFIQTGAGIGSAFSGPLSNFLQNRGLNLQANVASASNALQKYKIQVERENQEADRAFKLFGNLFGA